MKLLITGGCGFLGSNIARQAILRKDELYVFDNLQRSGSSINLEWLKKKGGFSFIHGDIRNYNDVYQLIKKIKPDIIFHLAGQVAMTTSISNPRMDFEINAIGTYNLLEAVRLESPETGVIYSSTNKVYGDLEQFSYEETETRYRCKEAPNGFDEKTQLDFHSPYGCSKGTADQYILDYARIFSLKTAVFRHSSMYGGRQFSSYDQGWIGWFCEKAIRQAHGDRTPFTIAGNGKQVRDLLYADDMIELYFKAANSMDKLSGHAFNVGGGINNSLSILELFNTLENELGIVLSYRKIKTRQSDQKFFVANINRIKETLDWIPRVDKDSGIRKMLSWVSATI